MQRLAIVQKLLSIATERIVDEPTQKQNVLFQPFRADYYIRFVSWNFSKRKTSASSQIGSLGCESNGSYYYYYSFSWKGAGNGEHKAKNGDSFSMGDSCQCHSGAATKRLCGSNCQLIIISFTKLKMTFHVPSPSRCARGTRCTDINHGIEFAFDENSICSRTSISSNAI